MQKWSREKIWQWYQARPWWMGFNYVPGPVRNSIEWWQEDTFAQSMTKIEPELKLATQTGFNALRIFPSEFVWQKQRRSFMQNLEIFIDACDRYGLGVMIVIFNDCLLPEEMTKSSPLQLGPQPDPDWGYHGGTRKTPFDGKKTMGWWDGDDPTTWPEKEAYVKDLVGTYAKDPRIICWDIWNEPGNSHRDCKSLPLMEKAFGWARELDPIQPLTACAWGFEEHADAFHEFFDNPLAIPAIQKRAIELSDIITFHCYGQFKHMLKVIEHLNKFERPIMNTEWLHRPLHNLVEDCLPLFARVKIGSFHWGLVNGMGQFHELWDFLRDQKDRLNLDMNSWQHDIYRDDHTPYRLAEIELFKAYGPNLSGLAEK